MTNISNQQKMDQMNTNVVVNEQNDTQNPFYELINDFERSLKVKNIPTKADILKIILKIYLQISSSHL